MRSSSRDTGSIPHPVRIPWAGALTERSGQLKNLAQYHLEAVLFEQLQAVVGINFVVLTF